MFGLGGELSKEVAFVIILLYYFVMFSGLMGPLSIKLLYYTAYFFKIWTHFAIKNFVCFA